MRPFFSWMLGSVALLTSPAFALAADDAAAIIDKAIKAHGGAEKLGKFKGQQWKSKGVVHAMGVKIDFAADYWYQQPNLFRFDMAAEFMGQKIAMVIVTDGKKFWEKMGDQALEMDKKKAEAFQHSLYAMHVSSLLPLKEKEYTFSVIGEEKIDDKPVIGVLVSRKGHQDVTLFFDKDSGLLLKSLTQVWDEFSDKDVAQEVILMDYKDMDGLKIFSKMLIKRDGKIFLEEELSEQQLSEKLDPKLFEKP